MLNEIKFAGCHPKFNSRTNSTSLEQKIMSNSNPIEVLVKEHDIISMAEGIVRSLQNTWEINENKYSQKVGHLILFFREYSDQFHHHKEEEVLFKKLRDNPDFLLNDIISELEGHHEMFRETVAEIEDALQNKDWPQTQKLLKEYVNDLLDHIAVENDELFNMAESVFSDDELERIYFLFEDIDRDLGQERKLELEEGLKRL